MLIDTGVWAILQIHTYICKLIPCIQLHLDAYKVHTYIHKYIYVCVHLQKDIKICTIGQPMSVYHLHTYIQMFICRLSAVVFNSFFLLLLLHNIKFV